MVLFQGVVYFIPSSGEVISDIPALLKLFDELLNTDQNTDKSAWSKDELLNTKFSINFDDKVSIMKHLFQCTMGNHTLLVDHLETGSSWNTVRLLLCCA